MLKPLHHLPQEVSVRQLARIWSRDEAVVVAILRRIISIRNRGICSRELIELIRNHFIGQQSHGLNGLRLFGLLERSGALLHPSTDLVCVVAQRFQFLRKI